MSGYQLFSQFYDNLTFNVDYSKRADYIQSVLSLYGHDWGLSLDLACGTGSLTVELKRRGVDIFGIDGSYDMLSVAMEKASDPYPIATSDLSRSIKEASHGRFEASTSAARPASPST